MYCLTEAGSVWQRIANMRTGDHLSPKAKCAVGVLALSLFVWVLPEFHRWLKRQNHGAAAVQTYVLIATCPRRPGQHEQVVVLDDGAGSGRCMYVTARGAYGVTR